MGFWNRGWFRSLVVAVAVSINPFLGIAVGALWWVKSGVGPTGFDENVPVFVKDNISKWVHFEFNPYIREASRSVRFDQSLEQITNILQIITKNNYLKKLAILKVYYDFKASNSTGNQKTINEGKSEFVGIFLKEISKGYEKLVRKAMSDPTAQSPIVTYREEIVASNTKLIASNIKLDWEGNKVLANYRAFALRGTVPIENSDSIEEISTGVTNDVPVIDDPIDDTPVIIPDVITVDDPELDLPPVDDGGVIIVDTNQPDTGGGVIVGGSGSDSGNPTTTDSGDNGTVQPSSDKKSYTPWIWIASGLVGYYILKKK